MDDEIILEIVKLDEAMDKQQQQPNPKPLDLNFINIETRCGGYKARIVIRRLGFPLFHIEEVVGYTGMGDFNEIAGPSEKKSGGKLDIGACKRFNKWIEDCSLIDLGAIGMHFTWRGPKWNDLEKIFKMLDRTLANMDWKIKVDVLSRLNSDHHPLIDIMDPHISKIKDKPFRYEAM
ncbi:hypothetical protein Ahy_A05g023484 [Arachis hypogaea]|uniref:Endonuclease/exonuclease/phosphatase domain-containing protein n=1 Tax=Arachis hypogaea TaxID=3818 RepID=A0A445D3L6_ARAHY|nr:hypothetical protein Ahy_A05g023484 [Arachis hypogaea]